MYQEGQASADHTAKQVFEQTLQSFAEALLQLADKQRPLDPEFAKVLNENLEYLYSDAQPAESKRVELSEFERIVLTYVEQRTYGQEDKRGRDLYAAARALLARAQAKGQ